MTPKSALNKYFGYDSFRPGQEEIINAILEEFNVLAVLPTGAGKSLCYQIPALLKEHFSIVISPLISLMKDQVDALNKNERIAAFINSSLDYSSSVKVLNEISQNKIKLLYVSPERLGNNIFVDNISALKPEYVFVDEAHCISEWGHSFRPSYMRIVDFCNQIGIEKISAFTATAVPEVRKDIIEMLDFKRPKIFISGFERDNLHLNVIATKQKKEKTLSIIKHSEMPAIIYCATRKQTEEISNFLAMKGIEAPFYHAGLTAETRQILQNDFFSDHIKCITATNAFGMGIDKSDIRTIIHASMPGSVENYYQEIGRAGRDQKQSKTYMLFDSKDTDLQEFLAMQTMPTKEEIFVIYNAVYDFAGIAVGSMSDRLVHVDEKFKTFLKRIRVNQTKFESGIRFLKNNDYLQYKHGYENRPHVKTVLSSGDFKKFILSTHKIIFKDLLAMILRNSGNNLFNSFVSIDLEGISSELAIDAETLEFHLDELNKIGILDYEKPPNAPTIRLLKPREKTESLGIDFKSLEKKWQYLLSKIEKMNEFVRSTDCRMNFVLAYFGEVNPNYKCGKCDNCLGLDHSLAQTDEYVEEIIIQTIHEFGGSIKDKDLVKLLAGKAKHPEIIKTNNYGVCRHFSKKEIENFVSKVMSKKLINDVNGRLAVSDKGMDEFILHVKDTKRISANVKIDEDLKYLNALREVRAAASKKFTQKPEQICNDEVLMQIAKAKPDTPSKILSISGFTRIMFNKAGEDFLEAIIELNKAKVIIQKSTDNKIPDTIKLTYDLVKKKYSLEDIASLTKLPEAVVSMQIESIIEYFPDTDISNLFKKSELELISTELSKGLTELKEIKEVLPSFVSYGKIRIALAKHKKSN